MLLVDPVNEKVVLKCNSEDHQKPKILHHPVSLKILIELGIFVFVEKGNTYMCESLSKKILNLILLKIFHRMKSYD